MITGKRIDLACVIITLLALIFTILFMNGEALGLTKIVDDDEDGVSYFSANDLRGDWGASASTHIALEGDSATVNGNGAYYYEGDVVITSAGYYVVSGTLDNGSLIVDSSGSSKVWIKLDGVDIHADDDAAIRVDQAKKVFLTLAEGSANTLSSGSDLSDSAVADGTDGVIYAHDNLCINGSGSLDIDAGYMHGIVAKDNLILAGGSINIKSSGDGIRANESLRITEALVNVSSGDDAIMINQTDGYLYIASGSVSLKSQDDAVNALGDVTVDGGSISITAGDDGIHSDKSVVINGGSILMEKCYEGIEAVTVTLNDGEVTIYPSDDGINANGGGFDTFAGPGGADFAASQDQTFERPGGASGFPGFGGDESSRPERPDGVSGFPGSGSDDSSSRPERPDGTSGFPGFAGNEGTEGADVNSSATADTSAPGSDAVQADSETYIRINGGKLTIINTTAQDADGLDSNGSIYITGGDIRISLPGKGTNSAIDYASESNGVCFISGGTVIACGGYMMAEGFDSSSEQCSILYNISDGVSDGAELTLEDADGNILLDWEVPTGFTSASISCPEMQVGSVYTVKAGELSETITLDEVSSAFGDAESSGFGGPMNWGGFGPGKN